MESRIPPSFSAFYAATIPPLVSWWRVLTTTESRPKNAQVMKSTSSTTFAPPFKKIQHHQVVDWPKPSLVVPATPPTHHSGGDAWLTHLYLWGGFGFFNEVYAGWWFRKMEEEGGPKKPSSSARVGYAPPRHDGYGLFLTIVNISTLLFFLYLNFIVYFGFFMVFCFLTQVHSLCGKSWPGSISSFVLLLLLQT